MPPYNEIHQFPRLIHNDYHFFQEGAVLPLTLMRLNTDGQKRISPQETIKIKEIKSGGFNGKVLIPETGDFVIKTTLPDPWHHLWRTINWDLEQFPGQHEEVMAQIEHVAGRIIHTALPILTQGKFYSPNSLGYTLLPTGYAQIVEKMVGRPPRYDTKRNEFNEFRKAQEELTKLAFDLGLEQVGQIHDKNIYGMANLWFDNQNNRWIWLDTIPAIPHRGFVYPFYRFKFHQEIRDRLNNGKLTFNTIHTDKFLQYISEHRELFPDETFDQLTQDLALYELKSRQYAIEAKHRRSIDTTARALTATIQDNWTFPFKLPFKIIKKAVIDPARIVFDKNYRVAPIIKRMNDAYGRGLVTSEELERSMEAIRLYQSENGKYSYDNKVLTALLATYVIGSMAVNLLQAGIAGNVLFGGQDLVSAIESFIGLQAVPFLFRPGTAYVIGKLTKTDLRAAMSVSWVPTLGILYSVPAQVSAWTGSRSREIWHHTVRNFITRISSLPIFPYGGLGSQFEGQLMQSVGKRIESLVQFED
ncbi:hypothetical protein HY041_02525 [Candidatus Roizmanbacteria bacterium]|nr:hypothetical protein [Candidatus Roizmanbacteria bacterium]